MSLWVSLLQFTIGAALIGRAGFVLSRSADRLARHHGWSRGWVGLAMLATVTSLPELSTGVSAVAWVDAPNLAVGDALGSCVFNLVFLVVIDALHKAQPMYREASSAHLLSAAFGVVMLGFVSMSLLLAKHAPSLFHVGIYSPLLIVLYLVSLASVNRHESNREPDSCDRQTAPLGNIQAEWRSFAMAAGVVAAAGVWLPTVAEDLVKATGFSRSVVGTLGLALATSLPEIAVSLAALRLRALDLAIANLLGSNLFNVVVLAVDDLVYLRGPLLVDASPVHAATAVTATLMTGLVLVGLIMRPQGRVLRVTSWISIALLAAYAINAALLYLAEA